MARFAPDLALVKQHYATIGIAAVALLLIGFSQTAGDARAFAARHRYRVDVNQESVAQGMANLGAGVFQGMPVSTSLSAGSLNESAGASTPVASLTTGALAMDDVTKLPQLKQIAEQLADHYASELDRLAHQLIDAGPVPYLGPPSAK